MQGHDEEAHGAQKNMAGVRKRQVRSERKGVNAIDDWFDPIETQVRDRVRSFIQAMIEVSWMRACNGRPGVPSGLTSY